MEKEQNFLNQISAEKLQATPPGFYKSIFLELLSIVAAFIFGYLYYLFIKFSFPLYWILVSLVIFGTLQFLRALLVRGALRALLVTLFEVIGIILPFYLFDKTSNLSFLVAAALVMITFFFFGNLSSKQELENEVRIKFFKIGKKLIGKFITAVALAVVILYLPYWQTKDIFISEKNFQSLFSLATSFAQKLYPEINFNSTLEEFAETLAKFQLEKNKSFFTFSSTDRQKAIQNLSSQILKSIIEDNSVAQKNENLGKFTYYSILNSLTNWYNNYQHWFLIVWATAVFVVLKILGFIFAWILLIFAFFVYQLLLNFEIISATFENRAKENVEFS